MNPSIKMVTLLVCVLSALLTVAWAPAADEASPAAKRQRGKRNAARAGAAEDKKGARRGAARDNLELSKVAELAEQAKAANRGVLNGPLMAGGHQAKGEGDGQSLKLAIEDLIATHGDGYPRGKEFLQRLAAVQSESSEEFLALKKEALQPGACQALLLSAG